MAQAKETRSEAAAPMKAEIVTNFLNALNARDRKVVQALNSMAGTLTMVANLTKELADTLRPDKKAQ